MSQGYVLGAAPRVVTKNHDCPESGLKYTAWEATFVPKVVTFQ